ncbi:diguanylate cyclase [Marinobacterium aestuarii]|uniref:Diguanylate cyclase n=1 Tax=Marinobacterium aestuarii TaxID=1821621 RepID=A0A1A9F1U4_9GAMM|nr:DinB family protein [Marinobacterium aestuarii]ANG64196.1 diguanylate cyclase [Marinobacterium aestuarii]
MEFKQQLELLASYNAWMNLKTYEAAARLDSRELARDSGAFFGSVLGTLNHIVVGDTIWLQRFATHPACGLSLRQVADLPPPVSLDQLQFKDLPALTKHRVWLDEQISQWIAGLTENDLEHVLHYRNTKGIAANKRYASLILHFFNHQTHHRGQVSTLLHQAGEDIGVTDLLALIPDEVGV